MKTFLQVLACSFVLSAVAGADITPVATIDLSRYAGTWYQIARNQIIFEPSNCFCERQVLTPRTDGKVDVYNSCNEASATGKLDEIRGTAEVTNPATPSKISVDFGSPVKGDYWIIALDADYRYAVVTDRFAYSLYILSRTPVMPADLYTKAVNEAAAQVSVKKLILAPQDSCKYPQ